MRKLITVVLVSLIFNGLSQSNIDKLVFSKINTYRISKGLKSLQWDIKTYRSSEHHTKYLVKHKIVGHREKNNTPTLQSRLGYYGVNFHYSGETCLKVIIGITEEYSSNEYLSQEIFDTWKNSPDHNEIMLGEEYTHGGISCIKDGNSVYSTLNIYGSSE